MQITVMKRRGDLCRGLRRYCVRHLQSGRRDRTKSGSDRDHSALTGHLVFTTVHANNVIDVIGRFLNMQVDLYNFVAALNCVLAQRLVRKLCPTCKRAYEPALEELTESGMRQEDVKDQTFYRHVGCDACNHTGYRGRTAIHELLDMSDTVREMIIARRPGSEIRRQAEKGTAV